MKNLDEDTSHPLYAKLRKLITLIDQLRDVGVSDYIKLPRIAVLGTQSSGKSSVLESIVGIDFLPRGDGVVTRRPLEMRLTHLQDGPEVKAFAHFEELKGEKFTDFNVVRQKIEELTDKVCGKSKGIIDKPIILNISSPTCPDLTLIDLPGITRIPLKGSDQPADIELITKNMATRYCIDPRTIILCVIPANQDLSTSDGLKMARDIDVNGDRTIGVITKVNYLFNSSLIKNLNYLKLRSISWTQAQTPKRCSLTKKSNSNTATWVSKTDPNKT